MDIPEGFTNVRFIFRHTSITDEMGFSLAVQGDIGTDAQEIADQTYASFKLIFANTAADFYTGWIYQGTVATQTVGGAPVVGEHIFPVAGTAVGVNPVANTALLVRKNTALGGRRGRGRMFIPPFNMVEASVDVAGMLTPAYQSAMQTAFNSWHAGLTSSTPETPPWLLHANSVDPDTGEEIPDTAPAPTPITSFTVSSLVGTQRRRIR